MERDTDASVRARWHSTRSLLAHRGSNAATTVVLATVLIWVMGIPGYAHRGPPHDHELWAKASVKEYVGISVNNLQVSAHFTQTTSTMSPLHDVLGFCWTDIPAVWTQHCQVGTYEQGTLREAYAIGHFHSSVPPRPTYTIWTGEAYIAAVGFDLKGNLCGLLGGELPWGPAGTNWELSYEGGMSPGESPPPPTEPPPPTTSPAPPTEPPVPA
ncbi:MAG: hypothetical protein DCC49_06895 [Acidobacteria bacterium]|nr:MAG: hypothetical protein DCC49_06895 [Acidobacteriota bacterium]